ncbi:hypothetical protein [uncultured Brevundimonas sp.]|uniref:hypothetical protein n=1 Tax=uncultured Brevundimonas sp. TaxID=213418 RepID=UPI0030EBE045|tara:strand:- start:3290 stop:3658 length:369 start_codon:yes stop_codon:yes gene_type:complete
MDESETYRRRLAVRHRSLRRLGVLNVRCICGETDATSFEADHIYRRELDGACWGICVNCHRKRSARAESEHPKVGCAAGDPLERQGHLLLGVRDYLTFIAGHLDQSAELMFRLAAKGRPSDD